MRLITTIAIAILSVNTLAQNYYIAHRGASYSAPENTVASALLAWQLGADAVEIDVHLSGDNKVMVIHDRHTRKTSANTSNLLIHKTDSEKLRTVDVGSFKGEQYAGEKIPFLKEILATIPQGKTLVIEIKCGPEILPSLLDDVRVSGKLSQLQFISFDWKTILATQKMFPQNKCYYLKSTPVGLHRKMRQSAKEGLAGVNLNYRIIDQQVMKRAAELNIEVLTWTVDNPEVAKNLNGMGVTKITTNRPEWLKQQIEISTH
jgi:glycerophosphoryl diester phosphodiesterase